MRTITAILLILAAVCYALDSHLMSDGRRHTAYFYLSIGLALSGFAILLYLVTAAQQLFKSRYVRRSIAERQVTPQSPPVKIESSNPLPPPSPNPTELPTPTVGAQPPKPTKSVKRDDYEPDKIALEVLKHIHQVSYPDPVKVLPAQLNIDPLEIEVRLDKLQQHHYVNYNRLQPVRGYSPYSLTAKGREYLLTTPVNRPPFGSGEPSENEIEILKLIASPSCESYPSRLAMASNLHPERLIVHLTELEQKGYIVVTDFHPATNEPEYRLTHKARKFLMEKNLI